MHDFGPWWGREPTGRMRFAIGSLGRVIVELQVLETVVHPGTQSFFKKGDTRLKWEKSTRENTEYLIRLGVMTTEQE